MAGRPTKYTPAVQKRILAAIRLGATYQLAAQAAGINYDTLNEWRKAKPGFSEAIEKAEGEAVARWLELIQRAADDGNWQAAAWKLERRYPRDYGRTVTEQTGEVQVTVRVSYVADWRALPTPRVVDELAAAPDTDTDAGSSTSSSSGAEHATVAAAAGRGGSNHADQ